MPLQIFPKESSARADATARALLEHLSNQQHQLRLDSAVVFFNFPLFREDERLLVADLVLVSPYHGVLLISTVSSDLKSAKEKLEGSFSQIFARFVKYPRLRSSRAQLSFHLDAFIWQQEGHAGQQQDDMVIGLPSLDVYLSEKATPTPIQTTVFDEILSILDGSKALVRAKERNTSSYASNSKVATIARLEEEIRRFDRDQRVAYMTEVNGPQRIRGLAGSGKTVVLALKAALTAIREPEAKIAVTFYTKSLYQHIRQLITRFYRLHEDRDPDWSKLQVLHAWGGATIEGLYYKTAQRFGHQPISYGAAAAASPQQPFGFVCERLLNDPSVHSSYDYVFVDEAQDFPPSFMKLALRLAIDEKLVIAYDVFQTIFDVEVPTAAILFGADSAGSSDLVFDEDIILHKCYRNPREILVCAHAIGFGIYSKKIVQMLESPAHWQDFGYETKNTLSAGEQVKINRPPANSPSSISSSNSIDQIISAQTFTKIADEIAHVSMKILNDIRVEGVAPEDILVISADDRNAAMYFSSLKKTLSSAGIRINNLQDESFQLRDFQTEGAVTLSTIYKAKGNEAYSVYLVGIDALFYSPTPRNRNRAFTAMTRAKGWLHITGMEQAAEDFCAELTQAKSNFPDLVFRYPSPAEIVYMKRDLTEVSIADVDAEISRLGDGLDAHDLERLLRKKLRELQGGRRIKKRMK
jgi:superfamily I DNA and RNA helicase